MPDGPPADAPRTLVVDDAPRAAAAVAGAVAVALGERRPRHAPLVLGLPTGRTFEPVYAALVAAHLAGTSFAHAVAFGLDELHPIGLRDPGAFHLYLHERFFDRVDLPRDARHVLHGDVAVEAVAQHCDAFEQRIAAAGGLDLLLLGLGRNGHVAFNEPGSAADSRTRRVALAAETRADLASSFGAPERVPAHGLTMGVATLLAARRVLLVACGAAKAAAVRAALRGPVGAHCPASFLRRHPDVTFVLDAAAAAGLGERAGRGDPGDPVDRAPAG